MRQLTEAHNRLEECTDEELMIRVQEEDSREAFAVLCSRISPRLLAALLRAAAPDDAEDLMQETWSEVWRNRSAFQARSKLYTWIYRIAQNEAINLSQKRRTLRRSARTSTIAMNKDALDQLASRNEFDSVEEDMVHQERMESLQEALHMISANHRAIIELVELQELPYEVAAGKLDVAIGTVRSRLYRARGELREVITQSFPMLADPL